jgi:hypothetical protein
MGRPMGGRYPSCLWAVQVYWASNPKDYESPGELDAVAGIKKLETWTKEWIAAQQDIIKPCSEAIGRNLLKNI